MAQRKFLKTLKVDGFRCLAASLALVLMAGCDDGAVRPEPTSTPKAPIRAEKEKDVSAAPARITVSTPSFESSFTFSSAELRAHATALASDEYGGRLTGTVGCQKARDYIVDHFRRWGLEPGHLDQENQPSYLHPFSFISGVEAGKDNYLAVQVSPPDGNAPATQFTCKPGVDFQPLRLSQQLDTTTASLVFVGYGISDSKAGYDDYAGLDVEGKIVLALRGEPENDQGQKIGQRKADPHAAEGVYSDFFYKAATARDKKVKALLLVKGYQWATESERNQFLPFNEGGRIGSGLPVFQVRAEAAESWLQASGKSLKDRQAQINQSLKPASEEWSHIKVTLNVDVRRPRGNSENVVGFIPGTDEKLKHEILVIGAHYDHLGQGNEFSLADKSELGKKIHYGADDNASGTASMLELARAFAANKAKVKRTTYFIAFSGEELGTLGSLHFVTHPSPGFALSRVAAMLNLDMVGRCTENKLLLAGLGSADDFAAILERANESIKLNIQDAEKKRDFGFGGSDHLSFRNKGVPVLFFFTGPHPDYHKPSDTVDKLNLSDQTRITGLTYSVAAQLNALPARPIFIKIDPPKMAVTGMGGIRMGTLPDYAYEGSGLRITGVRGGSPADKGGLKGGDVIVRFAGHKIENIRDYMNALGQCKPDVEIEVLVKRDGQEVLLKALPEKN